jgi:ATP adenylyltransferase
MSGFSASLVREATRRAESEGALQPIETRTLLVESEGVRFILRSVASLARKGKEGARGGAPDPDPLGHYDPRLFVADLGASHYVLLNKFPVQAGHVLVVSRRFERQDGLLGVDDFAALAACLREIDGLGFYNGGPEAGASQRRRHLQLVRLPLAVESSDEVPMERALLAGAALPFRHAFVRVAPQATGRDLHALYRELLQRCGIEAVASEDGELQSAPYNLLVRRGWMLLVPRSRPCVESIPVNGLGFAGSLFVPSDEALDRARALGPMTVLREAGVRDVGAGPLA